MMKLQTKDAKSNSLYASLDEWAKRLSFTGRVRGHDPSGRYSQSEAEKLFGMTTAASEGVGTRG